MPAAFTSRKVPHRHEQSLVTAGFQVGKSPDLRISSSDRGRRHCSSAETGLL